MVFLRLNKAIRKASKFKPLTLVMGFAQLLCPCCLLPPLTNLPAFGAERIAFSYPPFGEFYLSTNSLEVFAKQGKINNEFAFYARRATPQQLAQLRELLQRRFQVSPTMVSQFTYSPLGEKVIYGLGELLQTDTRKNGFYALRSALIISAAEPEGITVLNIVRRFPAYSIRLNLDQGFEIVSKFSKFLKQRDTLVAAIKRKAETEAAATAQVDFLQKRDLRLPGPFSWQKATLRLNDSSRVKRSYPEGTRRFFTDLYLPLPTKPGADTLFPVIVISHGAAENRTSFAYLAQHLASYGFAVAVVEHPGIDFQRFQQYFAGLAAPPDPRESIDQPLDVKYLLDELQRLSKSDPVFSRLNLQQVGVVGHSLGGYTALALAGAQINFEQLRKDCQKNEFLNMSLLVQCKTAELQPKDYALRDDRIKAVIAVNPLTSSIFGQSGLRQVKVPLMLVAASNDIATPAVPEQILPFTWLTTPDKYLVLLEKGTHFSSVGEMGQQSAFPLTPDIIGPDPRIARAYLSALSVAFMQTHVAKRPEYRPYLSAAYAKFLSQAALNLSLVQSFALQKVKPSATR